MEGRSAGWIAAFCLAVGSLLPGAAGAQQPSPNALRANPVVVGTLTDALSGAAVEGAMVLLLDPDGRVVQRAMTGPEGAFSLVSRRGGWFTVRADRIGHQSTLSEEFELHAGETVELPLVADVRVIELEAIAVDADPRCILRPEEGRSVAALWEEARKSLATAQWSSQHGTYDYEFVEFDRFWDRSRGRLESQTLKRRIERGQSMFGSAPIESLMRDGFVVFENGSRIYQGPDADVMLSDPFLDRHCFRIGEPTPTKIALEFEPVEGVELSDIVGVIWLDRSNGELLSIDYHYKNTGLRWDERQFGGHIEFDRLPSGPSIVRRWSIWMPRIQRGLLESRERWVGIRQQGAEVLSVRAPGTVIRGYPAGSIRGVVTRGSDTNSEPAAGVVVALADFDAWAESDSTGAFEIGPLIAGPYTIRVYDEQLARVGRDLPDVPVSVEDDQPLTRNLHLETPAAVLFEYCGRSRNFERTAVLIGRVRSADGIGLVDDAKVRVRWIDRDGRAERKDTDSNDTGFYRICGIPRDAQVTVTVEHDDEESLGLTVDVPLGATEVTLDLLLPTPSRSPSR